MNYIKRIFLVILFSPIHIYASTADDVFAKITVWWRSFFDIVNSFSWIFAVLPIFVVFYAISSARKKTISDGERGMGGPSQGTEIDKVGREVKYVIISIVALYVIYGTFGIIYTDSSGFSDLWKLLVMDFWKEVFGIS